MGEKGRKPFQLTFNGLLKVDFQGSRLTSDGGLILVRELDERLGLAKLIEEHLIDSRQGSNKKFPLADLLRQSVYGCLAGHEDLNDAMRVSAERVVLDMDSTERPVHGQQEGSVYNGHFESTCYHPLLLFSQHGDCLAAKLRPGNGHRGEDWDELLLPEIERQ